MSATIKDIAKRLRISPSTVSRALNNKPGISKKTISAVNIMANKLNYKRNSLAVSLRQDKSFCIGVVVPWISNYFFAEAISGIEHVAFCAGYQIIIAQTNDDEEEEKRALQALTSSRVDGILLSTGSKVKGVSHIRAIQKEVPIVLFDRTIKRLKLSGIGAEDYRGAYEMTKHLIKSGKRKIVHLSGPKNVEIAMNRLSGYKSALSKHKIPFKRHLVIDCDFNESLVHPTITKLISEGVEFDALFASNDDMAVQAIISLKKYGKKVPEDIAVAGFGNYPVSKIVSPQLSTVNHQPKEIGIQATKVLLNQIDQLTPVVNLIIKSELILRDSSCNSVD
ncbi:MAG: LacI family DNA-binding transcriptional regulator [Bacteroidota bacterium]